MFARASSLGFSHVTVYVAAELDNDKVHISTSSERAGTGETRETRGVFVLLMHTHIVT